MMIRPARRPATLVLILAFASVASTEAHAQFGKLKKKAAAMAVEASGVPTKPPTYVKSTTMTAAQLKQLNSGLGAMISKAPTAQKEYEQANKNLERQTQDYQKAQTEYDKKAASYNACVDRIRTVENAKHDSLAAKADQSLQANQMNESQEAQMITQAEKAQAAAERVANGTATAADRQTLADFQKTMAGVSAKSQQAASSMQEVSAADQAAAARLEKECGKAPVEPTPPASAPSSPRDILQKAGAEAAGTNANQFAVWLDDGDGYVQSNTVAQPGGEMTEQQASDFNAALKVTDSLLVQFKKTGVPY
jgi:hypothetical protein